MDENQNLAFVNTMPWARIGGTWYVRPQRIGWKAVTIETIPDQKYWGRLTLAQWRAYRSAFVENNLMSEEQANEIEKSLSVTK